MEIKYQMELIKMCFHFNHSYSDIIRDYTFLEVKYAKNKFKPEKEAQEKAFNETKNKLLEMYVK